EHGPHLLPLQITQELANDRDTGHESPNGTSGLLQHLLPLLQPIEHLDLHRVTQPRLDDSLLGSAVSPANGHPGAAILKRHQTLWNRDDTAPLVNDDLGVG